MPRTAVAVAAVALCLGGVVLPGTVAAALPAPADRAPSVPVAAVPVAAVAPEPCASTLLPLGEDAADPEATRLPLPATRGEGDPLAAPGLLVAAGAPAPPPVPATAWLVADLDSGEVLASCNARTPLATASTIKVLTALALLPDLDPATVHTAGRPSAQVGGSRVGLVEGSQYTVEDLAHGLMLGSGNDAAVALGELVGGRDVAVARMNGLADRLGAADTVAGTTTGLDAPGQVSTAHDLAVLARAALDEPRVAAPAATRRYDFPAAGRVGQAGRDTYEIQTTSRLLRSYPGATGLKGGYTRAAGGSYVGTAERDGRRYVVTLLRAQGRPWHHARDLLDWAWVAGSAAGPGVGTLAGATAPGAAGPAAEAAPPGATVPVEDPEASRLRRDGGGGGEDGSAQGEPDSPSPPASAAPPGRSEQTELSARAGPGLAVPTSSWVLLVPVVTLALLGGMVAVRAARRRGTASRPDGRV